MNISLEKMAADPQLQSRLEGMRPQSIEMVKRSGRKLSKFEVTLEQVRDHSEYLHSQKAKKGAQS